MARPKFPSDQQDQFMLRLPDGMRDRIKAAAASNNRSMNAEIADRLEYSFSAWPRVTLPEEFMGRVNSADANHRLSYEAALMSAALELFELYFPKPVAYRDRIREAVDQYFDQLPNRNRGAQREQIVSIIEAMFKEHGAHETSDGYGLRNIQRRFGETVDDDRQPLLGGLDEMEPEKPKE